MLINRVCEFSEIGYLYKVLQGYHEHWLVIFGGFDASVTRVTAHLWPWAYTLSVYSASKGIAATIYCDPIKFFLCMCIDRFLGRMNNIKYFEQSLIVILKLVLRKDK